MKRTHILWISLILIVSVSLFVVTTKRNHYLTSRAHDLFLTRNDTTEMCKNMKTDLEELFEQPFSPNPNSEDDLKSGKKEGDLFCDMNTEYFATQNPKAMTESLRTYFDERGWKLDTEQRLPHNWIHSYYKNKNDNILADTVVWWNEELCNGVTITECNPDQSKLKYQISFSLRKQFGPVQFID